MEKSFKENELKVERQKQVRIERTGAVKRVERACISGTQIIVCVNAVPSFV